MTLSQKEAEGEAAGLRTTLKEYTTYHYIFPEIATAMVFLFQKPMRVRGAGGAGAGAVAGRWLCARRRQGAGCWRWALCAGCSCGGDRAPLPGRARSAGAGCARGGGRAPALGAVSWLCAWWKLLGAGAVLCAGCARGGNRVPALGAGARCARGGDRAPALGAGAGCAGGGDTAGQLTFGAHALIPKRWMWLMELCANVRMMP